MCGYRRLVGVGKSFRESSERRYLFHRLFHISFRGDHVGYVAEARYEYYMRATLFRARFSASNWKQTHTKFLARFVAIRKFSCCCTCWPVGGKRATTAKRKTPIFSPVIGRHRVRHVLPCTASTLSGIGVWRTEAVADPRRARRIIIIIIIRAPFFFVDSVGKA